MIKILFLAANPTDSIRLRIDEESRAIDQALQQTEFRDRFDIIQHWAVRVSDLQSLLLRHKPQIVHFSGHGSESSEIVLEDDDGKSRPISVRALGQLFSVLKDNIRCVMLNACYSEQQALTIAQYIDCVIGMSNAIGDRAAISFAKSFYQALGYGRNVKIAFDLACLQIDMERLEQQDIPKLLAIQQEPREVIFVHEESQFHLAESVLPKETLLFITEEEYQYNSYSTGLALSFSLRNLHKENVLIHSMKLVLVDFKDSSSSEFNRVLKVLKPPRPSFSAPIAVHGVKIDISATEKDCSSYWGMWDDSADSRGRVYRSAKHGSYKKMLDIIKQASESKTQISKDAFEILPASLRFSLSSEETESFHCQLKGKEEGIYYVKFKIGYHFHDKKREIVSDKTFAFPSINFDWFKQSRLYL